MPLGYFDHMNVISNSRSVRRVVISPENIQPLEPPDRDLGHKWQEIVGTPLDLANQPAFVRADGVQVAKYADAPAGVAGKQIAKHLLENEFRLAIRIDGLSE